ncbi:hypothetical protein QF032_003794 [Streptomyces achromogenes]|uniref:hypothetical protein n=1 Tax=Streptomyces achromogenes TaxID=67255 RepID=UPI00278127E8|nr:hypothetical protein [Streptomyces achromogenes]MDQ0831950.1 hypothetical protein [Streptomyces achromogenes]
MSGSKDMGALLDKVREQGFRVRLCGSGHYVVAGRRGVVSVSKTPSGGRAVANTRAALRRIGAVL